MGYTTSQSEAVWLTDSSNHCSFVLLLTTNSRPTLHLGLAVTLTLTVAAIWLNLSLSASLFWKSTRYKDTSNLYSFFGSQSVFAVCCSVFLAVCVNIQRSRQTVGQMCPVFTPLSSFTSNWLKTGCTELSWLPPHFTMCDQVHTVMPTNTRACAQIFLCVHTSKQRRNNRWQIFHS